MQRLIVISGVLLTSLMIGVAIFFFLRTQAINQQLALIQSAPDHVVNMSLMNQITDTFYNNLDLWEAILVVSAVILMIIFNFVFRPKSE